MRGGSIDGLRETSGGWMECGLGKVLLIKLDFLNHCEL
jgi:hypothetical protein